MTRAPGLSWGDDDDVVMAEVDPSVDADLESLRLAGREKLEKENKALLHHIFLAHTRRTKAPDAQAGRVANFFSHIAPALRHTISISLQAI